ncbi:MAG: DUF4116 domain-containing protein [Patescibacteria group bacterium]
MFGSFDLPENKREEENNKKRGLSDLGFFRDGVYEQSQISKITDKKIALEFFCFTRPNTILERVSRELQDDEEVVLAAINNNPLNFQYASKRLRGKRNIVLIALGKRGDLSIFVSDKGLLNDPKISIIVEESNKRLEKIREECGGSLPGGELKKSFFKN